MDNLKRKLGLVTAISIVIGSAIGSGIFKKPALMARELGSPTLLISVWVVAGMMTLFGTLSTSEIAALFPEAGGTYEFFKKMYGNLFSFLYGWAIFTVIQTGSIASIAYIFGESIGRFMTLPHFSSATETAVQIHLPFIGNFYPLADIGVKAVAIGLIFALTAVNWIGVVLGGSVQNIVTFVKVASLFALVVSAVAGHGSVSHFDQIALSSPSGAAATFGALIAALSGAFWAYDGWNNVTFMAGEIKNPQKNLPRSLLLGTLGVIALYVAINVAYIYVLPIESLAQSHFAAADFARASFGDLGLTLVLTAILISTFGACNGSLMAGPRVYFAMAREKMFFRSVGKISSQHGTPAHALVLQAVWTSVLVLSGTFDALTDMLIFVTWIFYAAMVFGVFVLRKKMPHTPRPYRVPGYPWIPAVFVIFAVIFIFETLNRDIQNYNAGLTPVINSGFGLFLVALGLPVYAYFNTRKIKRIS